MLTYGKSNICPYEWNDKYSRILSKLCMNSANARLSGSENGFAPAYDSEHGFADAPASTIRRNETSCMKTKIFYLKSQQSCLHDEMQNFDWRLCQCKNFLVVFDFSATYDSKVSKRIMEIIEKNTQIDIKYIKSFEHTLECVYT